MRLHRDQLHRLAATATLAVMALTVGGCGSDEDPEGTAGTGPSTSASSPSAPATGGGTAPSTEGPSSGRTADGATDGATDSAPSDGAGSSGAPGSDSSGGGESSSLSSGGSGQGSGGGQAEVDPNSPFVVAASAVATRSREQVTQLHAMGVGTTADSGLPKEQIPQLAKTIGTELATQIKDCTMLPPPKGSPAARLAAALADYRSLAGDLAAWNPNGQSMDAAWFSRLEGADRDWKAALRQLGGLSQQDLLAGLPQLLMPS